MGGGGKGGKVEYAQSPEQREIYKLAVPAIMKLSAAITGQPMQYTVPGTGIQLPGGIIGGFASNILGGSGGQVGGKSITLQPEPLYDIPAGWSIPDTGTLLPTRQNFEQFSPQVMEALYHPYRAGQDILLNTLAGRGQMGVPGAMSGAAGAALGKYWSEAAPQVTQQALGLMMPALQTGYQEQLGRAKTLWEAQATRAQMPFGILPGLVGGTYAQPVVKPPDNTMGQIGQIFGGLGSLGIGAAALGI